MLIAKYEETWVTSDSILNERSVEFSVSLKRRKNCEIQSCCREIVRKDKKSCDSRRNRESWLVCFLQQFNNLYKWLIALSMYFTCICVIHVQLYQCTLLHSLRFLEPRPHFLKMGKLLSKIFGNKEMRILMLGLDAAGKTSILSVKIQSFELITSVSH